MTANQAEYSVQLMSRTLGVSRSGFSMMHQSKPMAHRAFTLNWRKMASKSAASALSV